MKNLFNFTKRQKAAGKKYEKPDPKPSKVLTGMNRPLSTADHVRAVVQAELSAAAAAAEQETFDDSNDFDVEDEPMASQYTLDDDDLPIKDNPNFVEEKITPNSNEELPSSTTDSEGSEATSTT